MAAVWRQTKLTAPRELGVLKALNLHLRPADVAPQAQHRTLARFNDNGIHQGSLVRCVSLLNLAPQPCRASVGQPAQGYRYRADACSFGPWLK